MLHTNIVGIKLHSFTSTIAANSEQVEGKLIYKTTFHQTTADLGFDAASRLLVACGIDINEIGLLLFGSKTPDYRSPITAAVLQGRLNLTFDCICYDINLGINAFAQLTQIGSSVLKNTNKKYALLIFGDTPSKLFMNNIDNVFKGSDAATALLLEKTDDNVVLKFVNFSMGIFSDAIRLKSGGFRDFNPSNPFDATKMSNFVVSIKEELLEKAVQSIDMSVVEDFTKNTTAFYHSEYLRNVNPNHLQMMDGRIFADAAELPILLASVFESKIEKGSSFSFVSIGEGMSLYCMKINHVPLIVKTVHSSLIFDDFRISHEM